jgi:hypothetical protein
MFDSHMPCCAHAVPVPRHDHAVLKATSQDHVTVWHGYGMACVKYHRPSRDGMWETCPLSAYFGYHTEFHEGCYQNHTNPLNCRTSSSDISGYHADFHEGHGTVGEWQGRGTAWARHGICMWFSLYDYQPQLNAANCMKRKYCWEYFGRIKIFCVIRVTWYPKICYRKDYSSGDVTPCSW